MHSVSRASVKESLESKYNTHLRQTVDSVLSTAQQEVIELQKQHTNEIEEIKHRLEVLSLSISRFQYFFTEGLLRVIVHFQVEKIEKIHSIREKQEVSRKDWIAKQDIIIANLNDQRNKEVRAISEKV